MIPYYFTLGFVSVTMAFAYAYRLGEEFRIDGLQAGVLSAVSYMAVCFPGWSGTNFSLDAMSEVTGPNGIFLAILVSVSCSKYLKYIKTKKMLYNKKSGLSIYLSKGFQFLTPMAVMVSLMWALGWLSSSFLIDPPPTAISQLLEQLSSIGSDFINDILSSAISSLMYIIGMDGGRISQPIYSTFMALGGFGTLLPLVVLFLLSGSRHLKQIGKVSVIPLFFNIPYTFLYAVPVILSPIYAIPFLLCPIVTSALNYVVLASGILTVTVQTGMGYFSTFGSLSGILLQLINIAIVFLIYYPFFKYHETKILNLHGTQQEKKQSMEPARSRAARLLSGMLGVKARSLPNNRNQRGDI